MITLGCNGDLTGCQSTMLSSSVAPRFMISKKSDFQEIKKDFILTPLIFYNIYKKKKKIE